MILALTWALCHSTPSSAKVFSILHTNDWQSRLLGYPNQDFSAAPSTNRNKGGVARLATLLNQRRVHLKSLGPVLTLDSGDFTMGSLFHTISRDFGAEIQLLQLLGYDAITLGNHEFDFRPSGLAKMIRSAIANQGEVPKIVATNMQLTNDDKEDEGLRMLTTEGYIEKSYFLSKQGQRFAILGVLGKSASDFATAKAPVRFKDPIKTLQATVNEIRKKRLADIIILLSHSGIKILGDSAEGEEVDIAKKVEGIDIIVGAHSHTALHQPLTINNTIILQAGSETRYLGELTVDLEKTNRILSYKLHDIDYKVPLEKKIHKKIQSFKDQVSSKFLSKHDLDFDTPMVKINHPIYRSTTKHALGNLIAEGFRKSVSADIGFIPHGSIRDDMLKGHSSTLNLSDIFRLTPLGIGITDDDPGYPIIKISATSREIKGILEILLLAPKIKGKSYYPYFSGVKFYYSPYRAPLDRIVEIQIDGKNIDISDDDRLFTIATTGYVANFFGLIQELSQGIHNYQLKNSVGKIIDSVAEAVAMMEPKNQTRRELKEWQATLSFFTQESGRSNDKKVVPILITSPNIQDSNAVEIEAFSFHNLTHQATWVQWTFLVLVSTLSITVSSLAVGLTIRSLGAATKLD